MSKHMWRTIAFGLCVLAVASCAREANHHPYVTLAVSSVNIVDVEHGEILENRTLLINTDRIVDIVDHTEFHAIEGVDTIDGSDLYAMPGLWDMHMHMVNDVYEPVPWDFHTPSPDSKDQREIYLPIFLAFGVTGTRELSGGVASLELREKIRNGELLGPHMFVGSPLLDGAYPIWPDAAVIAIDGPENAREWVTQLHAQGFDFLKTYNLLSTESYRALHERAKELRMEVSGEIPISVSLWEAAELGHRTIEHLTGVEFACSGREDELRTAYVSRIELRNADPESDDAEEIWRRSEWEPFESIDPERCIELYRYLAEQGAWVVPTLQVQFMISHGDQSQIVNNPNLKYLSKWDRDIEAIAEEYDPEHRLRSLHDYRMTVIDDMYHAGVPILAGSDLPGGFYLHEELVRFVEGGLTPVEALRTATIEPAKYLGRSDELGSIRPGKVADVVLLRANPLEDIRNSQEIEMVIFQGQVLKRPKLDELLKQLEEDAKNWPE